ncbi:hypothetical protein [Actinokineospora globicatena]|uniref:hypothetical protein n=1 Tax=Actinokineospora globicatena TaxID=103729 RepID=UPI0020A46BF9|nr:hypothetical protein [Actinokineospora globicatena]MCP2303700.1 hypothetical protein [Actinokineospora globicatena]
MTSSADEVASFPRLRPFAGAAQVPVPRVPAKNVVDPDRKRNAGAGGLFFQNDAAGLDNSTFPGGQPPDPSGIAGDNHYVQVVNRSTMAVYRKSDLTRLRTSNLQTFLGAPSPVFDPHATLDYTTRRYAVAATDGTSVHLAVSSTQDAMGSWCVYHFGGLNADNPGGLADYPLIAFNDAFYISVTEFNSARQFTGNRMIIINREDLLACRGVRVGFFANLTYPGTTDRVGAIAPVTSTSTTNVTGGIDQWVASHAGGGSDITMFRYDTAGGLASYRMPSQNYATPPDAAQRNSTSRIDAGDSRIFQATDILYANGSGTGSIVFALASACTFDGNPNTFGCIEWFRVAIGCAGCGHSISDQAIFGFGADTWATFPSTAMDVDGNMIFNYAFSGTNFHPSAGTIGIRVLQGFTDNYFQNYGVNVYNRGDPSRWGDYTSIFLDPIGQNPGKTFWSASETALPDNQWGTHISGVQILGK